MFTIQVKSNMAPLQVQIFRFIEKLNRTNRMLNVLTVLVEGGISLKSMFQVMRLCAS